MTTTEIYFLSLLGVCIAFAVLGFLAGNELGWYKGYHAAMTEDLDDEEGRTAE